MRLKKQGLKSVGTEEVLNKSKLDYGRTVGLLTQQIPGPSYIRTPCV